MVVVRTASREVLFASRFQSTGISRTIRCRYFPPLIEAYNRSGNPGRFQLRVVSKSSFDVILRASSDGPQTPLLDTVMSFDATDDVGTQRSASSVKSCRAKPATPSSSAAPVRLLRIACSKRISSNIRFISLRVRFFGRCIGRLVRLTAGDSCTTLIQTHFGCECVDSAPILTLLCSFVRG